MKIERELQARIARVAIGADAATDRINKAVRHAPPGSPSGGQFMAGDDAGGGGGGKGDEDKHSLDPPGYAAHVRHYESQGMTTSDAQGTADADIQQGRGPQGKPGGADEGGDGKLAHSTSEGAKTYAQRVRYLEEKQGLTTSDAQGVVDAEDMKAKSAKGKPKR